MRMYIVEYKLYQYGEVYHTRVNAKDKYDAYMKATYEKIPHKHQQFPYSSWVACVIYRNGEVKYFNTFEGNPY